MCILFTKINSNPKPNEYHLVLVNVRDEYYWRPTQTLSFWENTNIIGAKDLQKGREGGTWLAMNTNGKIASLLNVLQPDLDLSPDKRSRGILVVDYLNNDLSPQKYLKQISEESEEYNGFRMIAIQINQKSIQTSVYSNFSQELMELEHGIHVFGNNKIEGKLWPKVKIGKQKFTEIVDEYNEIDSKPQLIDAIFELLSDKTKYPLDEQMKSQGKGKPIETLERMNAIHVDIPEGHYGSRTWSIILVDSSFNVDYIEKTMKDPIDPNEDIQWITTEKRFRIQ